MSTDLDKQVEFQSNARMQATEKQQQQQQQPEDRSTKRVHFHPYVFLYEVPYLPAKDSFYSVSRTYFLGKRFFPLH
jgi:hypothetical protein